MGSTPSRGAQPPSHFRDGSSLGEAFGEQGEHFARPGLQHHVRQGRPPALPDVDERDGHAALGGPGHEAVAGEDGQGRAHHEQHIPLLQEGKRGVHRGAGDVVPEEHDIGLERAVTVETVGGPERVEGFGGQLGVAIGPELHHVLQEAGIERQQALLQGGAGLPRVAGQTPHLGQRPMQLDDARAPSGMVQAVHVLGDEALHVPGPLQGGQGMVGGVGLGGREPGPAEQAPGPVPRPDFGPVEELHVLDGISRPGAGSRAAVVGDSRLGAASGPREHDGAPAAHQADQRLHIGGHGGGGRGHRKGRHGRNLIAPGPLSCRRCGSPPPPPRRVPGQPRQGRPVAQRVTETETLPSPSTVRRTSSPGWSMWAAVAAPASTMLPAGRASSRSASNSQSCTTDRIGSPEMALESADCTAAPFTSMDMSSFASASSRGGRSREPSTNIEDEELSATTSGKEKYLKSR
ncbi:hypothetical protein STIAU_4031 [Stigmatella aurantiaca DW4/3-1]|uniref:Uncharacterized protein n=1 Tax=Stigmatella aurantiaca (strain DW4/3-1) TaxID=378806 RepID=Q08XM6_STIAD|nr:hypothetical protein STIAU_4031 [Stigmatella aurantiaca DW4/3-1]